MKIDKDRLIYARTSAGMTQDALSAASGITRDTISKLETGQRLRSHGTTVAKLAVVLEVSQEYLCGTAAAVGASPPGEDHDAITLNVTRSELHYVLHCYWHAIEDSLPDSVPEPVLEPLYRLGFVAQGDEYERACNKASALIRQAAHSQQVGA